MSYPRLLSVQSHTINGYVGNKAAVFPLQSMGFNVDIFNTVTLSNHLGFLPTCQGEGLRDDLFDKLFYGLESNNLLEYDVLVSGYTRSIKHLLTLKSYIEKINKNYEEKNNQKRLLYVLDPVLGDDDKYYVPEQLLSIYQSYLLPLSTMITPNYFECQILSGMKINTLQNAIEASNIIHFYGPEIVVMTGLKLDENRLENEKEDADKKLTVVLSYKEKKDIILDSQDDDNDILETIINYNNDEIIYKETKRESRLRKYRENQVENYKSNLSSSSSSNEDSYVFSIQIPFFENDFSGCGDLFTAFMTKGLYEIQHLYKKCPYLLGKILELTGKYMSKVLENTVINNNDELFIIESIEEYIEYKNKLKELVLSYNELFTNNSSTPSTSSVTLIPPSYNTFKIHKTPKFYGLIFDYDGTLTEDGSIEYDILYQKLGLTKGDNIFYKYYHLIKEEKDDLLIKYNNILVYEELNSLKKQKYRENLLNFIKKLNFLHLNLSICTRNNYYNLKQMFQSFLINSSIFSPILYRDVNNLKDHLSGFSKPNPNLVHSIVNHWKIDHIYTKELNKNSYPFDKENDDDILSYLKYENETIHPNDYDFNLSYDFYESIVESNSLNTTSFNSYKQILFVGDSLDDMRCGRASGCTTCLILTDSNKRLLETNQQDIDIVINNLDELIQYLV